MESDKSKAGLLGSTGKERRNNIIVIILGVILIAVVALFVIQRSDYRKIIFEINSQKNSIEKELSQMIVGYDSLETENESLNNELMSAQTKVKDLLVEVEQTKRVSVEKITRYQTEITSLRAIMRNYIVQVDSLNQRNKELMAENQEVKEQVYLTK